jgi:hypothetical protein
MGAGLQRRGGQLIQAGAAGHDIVHQGDAQPGKVALAGEGGPDVPAPFLQWLTDLGRGVAHPPAGVACIGEAELPRQVPGNLPGLVEAAGLQSAGMQGHGHDQVGQGLAGDGLGQFPCQERRQGEFAPVFQGLDQDVGRMAIDIRWRGSG